MKMKQLIHLGFVVIIALLYSSCATTHPNEALIVGEWKPIAVEKYFTPEEEEQLKNAQSQTTGTRPSPAGDKPNGSTGTSVSTGTPPSPDQSRGGDDRQGGKNPADELNRLIQAESRANIVIYPDHSAAKFYRARTVKATWKLKGKGTVLLAKDLEKKDKYRIDILEINENTMVVVENLPIGGIKVTYQKISEVQSDEAK
jgi:hypothetical protein